MILDVDENIETLDSGTPVFPFHHPFFLDKGKGVEKREDIEIL